MAQTAKSTAADLAPQNAAVICRGLVKKYADVTAVNGLDLDVLTGECFGLLGPNGAGKTTTVEILEGLTPADGGRVEILGHQWGRGGEFELKQRIGVQLQETQLADKLTVHETLTLFRSFYKRGRSIDTVIAMVELQEKRDARVGKLSGGQKQRLAVACALVSNPDLLFLDEPTTGLDPQARLKLWEIVERFKTDGGTVLLTTHYMEEAERLCNRVGIMDHGRIIALGTPAELINSLGGAQVIEFTANGQIDSSRLSKLPGVKAVRPAGGGFCLTVPEPGEAVPALLAELGRQGVKLDTLTTHQATLEDVFVSLTGRMLRDA